MTQPAVCWVRARPTQGIALTVKERETTALSFPAASIALTEKLWVPFERREVVNGELQVLNEFASTRHWKVEPASFEVKEKVGVGSWVTLPWPGPEVMLATGGVVSAVKPLNA
jgi:hypothetical protein